MESHLVSKNIIVSGRRTSMRLEPDIWTALGEIAKAENMTIKDICSLVDQRRKNSSLTSAIRVFVVTYYRQLATQGTPTTMSTPMLNQIAQKVTA